MPTAFLAPRLQGHESVACHPATLAARRGAARIRPRPHPMELLWGNLKATELANLCPDTLDEATPQHTPACMASAAATSCVSTSSPRFPRSGSRRPALRRPGRAGTGSSWDRRAGVPDRGGGGAGWSAPTSRRLSRRACGTHRRCARIPSVVVAGQPLHQLDYRRIQPSPAAGGWVRPPPADQLAVPPKQRRRGDQEDRPPLAGQQLRQRGQDHPVARPIPRTGHVPVQHGELVPQNRIGSLTAANHAENPPQDKEREGPYHHNAILPAPTSPLLRARALTLHPAGLHADPGPVRSGDGRLVGAGPSR